MNTKTIFAALMLIALTACKNKVKETAEMIDLFPDNLVWERILPVL